MFFHKKEKPDPAVFIFGGIALLILLSIGIVFFLFGQRPSADILNEPEVRRAVESVIPLPTHTPEQVKEAYKEELDGLLRELKGMDSSLMMVTRSKEVLVHIRVPKDRLDKHFQAVVALDGVDQSSDSLTREQIERIIADLLG